MRFLNLHEYQSKDLMESHQVKVQEGKSADTPAGAATVAASILSSAPGSDIILKAQIHAGGRGKGHFVNSGLQGGVKILSTADEVESFSQQMFGDKLVTKQVRSSEQRFFVSVRGPAVSLTHNPPMFFLNFSLLYVLTLACRPLRTGRPSTWSS